MTKTVVYSHPAQIDLGEIGDYFATCSDMLPQRFIDAVDKTAQFLARVSDHSVIGTLFESDDPACQNIRIWRIDGFPRHLIFYRIENSTLRILRVLHGSRDYQNMRKEDFL